MALNQNRLALAFNLFQQNRLSEAEVLFQALISEDRKNYDAIHYLGILKASKGDLDGGLKLIQSSLKQPRTFVAYSENYASTLFQAGRFPVAIEACKSTIAKAGATETLQYILASSLLKQEKYAECIKAFDELLARNPNNAFAHNEKAVALSETGDNERALLSASKALELSPRFGDAWLNKANVLGKLKRHDEAIDAYKKAAQLNSNPGFVYLGLGNVYRDIKRYHEALAAYDQALSIRPNLAGAWLGRGNVFYDLNRYDEALAAHDKALSIQSDLEGAWLGRGNVFYDLNRYDEALAAHDKALLIKPDLEGALFGRGNVFSKLKRYSEAFAAYDRALSIKRDSESVEGARLHMKMHLCNWQNLESEIGDLIASVRSGKTNSVPFVFLSLTDSPADHLRCAEVWAAAKHPGAAAPVRSEKNYKHDKIRLGYVSADFRTHPVGYLTAGLFEAHDSSRFETYGFSIGPYEDSPLRRRLEKSFHQFFDLYNRSDLDIASAIDAAEIDILIDLNGYTGRERMSLFARHPAPVVVNYLGFAGTMGADFYDYVVVDRAVAPEDHQEYFSEKLVHLPHCFMPHDDAGRSISERVPLRSEHGLPENGFVYCCFNNVYKLNPGGFKHWMKILGAVDRSVFWLSDVPEEAKANLRETAKNAGIDPDRLIFAKRLESPADHLARHQLADLFLDTLPYNAHTTASDALWAGLPILTQAGNGFAARVAASLLQAIDLPELIVHSGEEYEALAIELARNPDRLKAIREKLARNRGTTPLFNTRLYTKHLEAAYDAMYRRHQAGLPPDHVQVAPILTE